ncbi:MAG: hypothetical protein MJ149_00175 [Clostridia bacterium]|nr:hypothetical protein [Clostridia bacterium]
MEVLNYKKSVKMRRGFMEQHKTEDFYYEIGESDILISMPHAVNQTRLGKPKYAEPGTVSLGLWLAKQLNASYIVKTQNNFDDANFDESSAYKDKIAQLIATKGIKYIIDLHGLKKSRPCDINLGTNFGKNIETDVKLYNELTKGLQAKGFVFDTDTPFMAPTRTIAGYFAKEYGIWTIQLEVNSKITNEHAGFIKFNQLVEVIVDLFKKK